MVTLNTFIEYLKSIKTIHGNLEVNVNDMPISDLEDTISVDDYKNTVNIDSII